ncbi:SUMO-activating enzyme subunit aos-1 [Aphelenchoides fujianensis]|nr:SUMO-activating enzyme subunit aos-1 [Aphelenchoides fujianensis]
MAAEVAQNPFAEGDLTKSEAELYDRQIRLWGVEAQNRIRASNILIVGLSGLGAEVAKNLILAGPKAVTLMDDHEIGGNDQLSQFLVPAGASKVNRAEASFDHCHRLNPLVKLEVDTSSLRDKPRDYYAQFTLLVLIDQDFDVIDQADLICRDMNIAFIAGGVFGWAGFGFFDFNGREFLVTKPKIQNAELDVDEEPAGPTVTIQDDEEKVKMAYKFATFAEAFDVVSKNLPRRLRSSIPRSYFLIKTLLKFSQEVTLTDEILEQAYRHELDANSHFSSAEETFADYRLFTGPQLGATCAIVGGFISQEAIKAISQNGEPLRNVLTYTALDTAYIANLPPRKE